VSPGNKFRALVQQGPVACLGAYDAMTSRLVQEVGARAMYVSGFAAAAAALGYADLGLVSQTEMAEHLRRICRVTDLPVIADADTGYGGILSVQRTVELWESAGAAGLHLEDQGFPKKCGHIAGKTVIPADEMVQKIKAALTARKEPGFYVIARTDAIAVTGFADALDRCRRYAEAGADALFVDAPESIEQLQQIGQALKGCGKPLVFNSARTGKSPFLSEKQLQELGFGIVLYPIEALTAAHRAVKDVLATIAREGNTDAVASRISTFGEINELVKLKEFVQREGSFR
jgi:2-methylisocitrate lyase-like PEP mutase family enzyme